MSSKLANNMHGHVAATLHTPLVITVQLCCTETLCTDYCTSAWLVLLELSWSESTSTLHHVIAFTAECVVS